MNPQICYITARRNPRFDEWFLPALARQLKPGENITVLKIDRFAEEPSVHRYHEGALTPVLPNENPAYSTPPSITVHVHPPKPCVWSGPHRLTSADWFSASSYRNSALCLTTTSHIAYVDDLSIPTGEWWNAAKEAATFPDTITCGLYSKIRDVVVEDGVVTSFTQPSTGVDRRFRIIGKEQSGPLDPGNMFGCSLVAPVESLLRVGGWPEFADGLSFEDCLLGCALGNTGQKFRYDRRLFTYEDEAAHHEDPHLTMIRRDKGVSPQDKSHAALAIAQKTKYFENYYPGSTRGLRDYVQQHGTFPIIQAPEHDWYDGQPLAEMTQHD